METQGLNDEGVLLEIALLMFSNISYLYSFDAINLQKLPFFHNRVAARATLLFCNIDLFSQKWYPCRCCQFSSFFSPLRPAEERVYCGNSFYVVQKNRGNMEIYKMGCDFFETNRKYLKVPEDFLFAIKTYDHCLPLNL